MDLPPSTKISYPYIKDASSEAKNLTTLAVSAGADNLFNGIGSSAFFVASSFDNPVFSIAISYAGVHPSPRLTEFTLILKSARSSAQHLEI